MVYDMGEEKMVEGNGEKGG